MAQPPHYPGPDDPGRQPYPGLPNPDEPASVPPSYPSYVPPEYGGPAEYGGPPEYGAVPGFDGRPGYHGQPEYGGPAEYGGPPEYGAVPGFDGRPGYHGQPEYAVQPEYGRPPAYGYPPAAEPARKSTTLPIVISVVVVVVVLCAGAAVAGFLFLHQSGDNPAKPQAAASTVTITAPATLIGRPRLTDPQYENMASILQSTLSGLPGATNSIGALYGTPDKQDVVVVTAAQAPIADPATELDRAFFGAGIGGLTISDVAEVNTGELGGKAKCGAAKSTVLELAFCSWADEGSLGMVMWYSQPVDKAKAEFPQIRAQIETKR